MAEGIFCHDFSAMSQCSSNAGKMQAASHRHRKEQETMLGWSCGYFAPHVSVAHFAPYGETRSIDPIPGRRAVGHKSLREYLFKLIDQEEDLVLRPCFESSHKTMQSTSSIVF